VCSSSNTKRRDLSTDYTDGHRLKRQREEKSTTKAPRHEEREEVCPQITTINTDLRDRTKRDKMPLWSCISLSVKICVICG
jgi:hypothetical protein